MTISPVFEDIYARMHRALALRDELSKSQQALRDAGVKREYGSTDNLKERSNPYVELVWTLDSAPTVTKDFSVLLGDCIQNLRAILDYCTWAVASKDSKSSRPRDISFPLYDKKGKFEGWLNRNPDTYGAKVMEVIEAVQPFHAPLDMLEPLRILQYLSNTDRHRLLNVVEHAHVDTGPVQFDPPQEVVEAVTAKGPIEAGEALAYVKIRRPLDRIEIVTKPTFGWYEHVGYVDVNGGEHWLRLDTMMNNLVPRVVEVLGLMQGADRIDKNGSVGEEGLEPPTVRV